MTTTTVKRSSMVIAIWGIVLGVATVLVYWFTSGGEVRLVVSPGENWRALTAVVMGAIAVASGVAIRSSRELAQERPGIAIAVFGIVLGVVTVLVYWFAAQADEYLEFGILTAVVLGAIAVASGAAIGSSREVGRWPTWESILSAVLAGVIGVVFWAWTLTVWEPLDVVKSAIPGYGYAIRDLFYGAWFLAAILVPYIVRRPGAAVAAEVAAAFASMIYGSPWGLTVLISGLAQGGLAEIVFALRGYKHYDLPTLIIASVAAALGSWVVDYAFWYSTLEVHILLLMLVARFISAAIFSGLLGKVISDALAATGVLDNTALGRARIEA